VTSKSISFIFFIFFDKNHHIKKPKEQWFIPKYILF